MLHTLPILICVLAISGGQILFKLAAMRLDASGLGTLAASAILNPPLIAALGIYGLTTFAWVWLLKDRALAGSYPILALSFVLVPLMGRVFLGESLGLATIAGALLVVTGVVVITFCQ